jgi:protein-tyrosine phosphatase
LLEDGDFDAIYPTPSLEQLYIRFLEQRGAAVAAAVGAIVDASEGGVVVHCQIGKDRTGIVAALLLSLAGVDREVIADDYSASATRVRPLVEDWIATAENASERERRIRESEAPRAAILAALQLLDRRYGGVERYLRSAGATAAHVNGVRERLCG